MCIWPGLACNVSFVRSQEQHGHATCCNALARFVHHCRQLTCARPHGKHSIAAVQSLLKSRSGHSASSPGLGLLSLWRSGEWAARETAAARRRAAPHVPAEVVPRANSYSTFKGSRCYGVFLLG